MANDDDEEYVVDAEVVDYDDNDDSTLLEYDLLESVFDNNEPVISVDAIVALLKKNPIVVLTRESDCQHRLAEMKANRKNAKKRRLLLESDEDDVDNEETVGTLVTLEESTTKLSEWLEEYVDSVRCCFEYKHRTILKCTCLMDLDRDNLLSFLDRFIVKNKKERQQTLLAIINSAIQLKKERSGGTKGIHDLYRLPLPNNGFLSMCVSSFRNLFQLRENAWKTLMTQLESGELTPPVHGNVGNTARTSNSMKKKAEEDVLEFLHWKGSNFGEPYATRFVRETTGLGIRDAEENVIELPSSFSKRGLFSEFCFRQGWKVPQASHKGSYGPISSFTKRTDDPEDEDWDPEVEPGPICGWSAFLNIWKTELPLVRIRPKSEDTCGECFIFKNRIKYNEYTAMTNEDDSDADVLEEEHFEQEESLVQKAYEHVEAARTMRLTIDQRIEDAQNDENIDMEHENRNYCLIVDYAQNLELPHLGEEQPGEIYYYSPKTVYLFGISDVSKNPSHLYAYTYAEEDGRKGSNNVASMLMKHLFENGILRRNEHGSPVLGKRLTIAADNCGGQNKNNTVIRLCNWIVEIGFFQEAEILFYVRGHTKNTCDRMFNLIKKDYHKQMIYTFDYIDEEGGELNLMQLLNKREDVTAVPVTPEDFVNWDSKLNEVYKYLASGTIEGNHVFRVTKEKTGRVITTKMHENSPEEVQTIGKRIGEQVRKEKLEKDAAAINPPGLQTIKRVDLYKKWRKFVPERFQPYITPPPSNKEIEEIAAMRREKSRSRYEKKKATQQRQG